MSGSTLRVISFLPSLLGCFFLLLAAFLLIGVLYEVDLRDMLLKLSTLKRTFKRAMESNRSTKTTTSDDRPRGAASYRPIWFAALCCAVLVYGATRLPAYMTVELHNVRVEKQVAANKWLMSDPVDGSFLWTGCHDFPNERVIQAGFIARRVKYEEHGDCKSILRGDLGFWWLRDENGNVRRIAQ